MVLPHRWRLIPMAFDAPLSTDYWDNDGSPEFQSMMKRLESEAMVLQNE